MATEASRRLGVMDCPVCGEVMPVRENGRGTLNLSCPWCEQSSYAKLGSKAHGIASGWIRRDVVAVAAAPVAVSSVVAAAAAVVKVTRAKFDLGNL